MADHDLIAAAEAAYEAGRLEEALETLERAHAEAIAFGDTIGAAAAATALATHLMIDTGLMAPVRAWARRAERLLDGLDETPVHARLAVVTACERWLSGDFESSKAGAERAVAVGDRQRDAGASTFGKVALARLAIFDGRIDEGLAQLDEAAGCLLSEDIDKLTAGCLYCEMVCIWQGLARYDKAEEWTAAMERFGTSGAVGSIAGRCSVHRAEILRLRGELEEAEREALHACDLLRPYMRYEFGWPLTELGRIRLVRGDLDNAETSFVEAHALGWEPEPSFARLQLARGDAAAALASIRDALDHPRNVPSKELPPNTDLRRAPLLEAATEAAVAAGDVDFAHACADELARIAGTHGGAALTANASLASGRVRLATGDVAGARRHLQNAVQQWSGLGAPYETSKARLELAKALRAGGNESIADLEERAARSALDKMQTHADPNRAEFRRDGDVWAVAFDDKRVLVRDMRGLHHLARLLASPDREFHAVDLAGSEPAMLGDAGAHLDEQAKRVYKTRLAEIEDDIDEAVGCGDAAREECARTEKEFIVRELSRAVGLGGRDRKAGATSERARASVTRAIRNAMAKLAAEHPALGEHLERTVKTGTYCSYAPDPRAKVTWVS